MATTCRSVVDVIRMRAARLAPSGAIQGGANNLVVSDATIRVGLTFAFEAGRDNVSKNGAGDICATYQGVAKPKGLEYDLTLCEYDVELFEMFMGGNIVTSGASSIGWHMPRISDAEEDGVSFEYWGRNWEAGAAASDFSYVRFGSPRVRWRIGDMELVEGIKVWHLIGTASENDNFNNGPADDWVEFLESLWGFQQTNSLPAATCGTQTLAAQVS